MGINFSSLFNQIGNNISELLAKYTGAAGYQSTGEDNDTSIFSSISAKNASVKYAGKGKDEYALANEALQLFDEAGIDFDSLYESEYN